MSRLRAAAPAKVNLCLYLGERRPDGLHDLVSVVQPLDLADELTLEPAGRDEVICPGVEGENLAERALGAYGGGPHRLTIDKRIPVAAGMGGGSSDAATALRLAAHAAGHPDDPGLPDLAAALGSDVTALLHTRATLVTSAGEDATALTGPPLARAARFAILPSPARLSTRDVYAEADRLGLARSPDELAVRRAEVEAALGAGGLPAELVVNDLEPAARSLCPAIDDALAAARDAGAAAQLVSGSGPTVVALFPDPEAAAALAGSWPEGADAAPASPGLTRIREE